MTTGLRIANWEGAVLRSVLVDACVYRSNTVPLVPQLHSTSTTVLVCTGTAWNAGEARVILQFILGTSYCIVLVVLVDLVHNNLVPSTAL